ESFDTLGRLLPVAAAVVRTMALHPERMRAALVPEMLATDLADYLVKKGMPFRQAHHVAGRAVRLAREQGIAFDALTLEHLQEMSDLFGEDVRSVFDYPRRCGGKSHRPKHWYKRAKAPPSYRWMGALLCWMRLIRPGSGFSIACGASP
ncbi:MAG: hypothetical protein MUC99_04850, partial [Anaerolineae bacterium]|nr:hypothetical protein [Anaerolineae bacterium]